MFPRHRAARRVGALSGPVITRAALAAMVIALGVTGCARRADDASAGHPEKLSDYGLFVGNGRTHEPRPGVIPYDLNTPLFSDYADKFRFVKLPEGTSAQYRPDETFDFPVGTVISKTFAYPLDARDPGKGQRLLETRIIKREADGWIGLPYVWNDQQTEAFLDVAGGFIDVSWIDEHGKERTNNYIIPNANQCKGCHAQAGNFEPLGPKARHLNKDFTYAHGTENQLAYWTRTGALSGAPTPGEAPRLAVWNDPHSGTLDQRARAWLETNCAHCHNARGPARNAGLDLMASQDEPRKYGIFKTTVAAGRGTGALDFDIVPGKPEESILMFRLTSTDAGIMMPELGKRLIHDEGVALVREWIASMPPQERPTR